jgi:cutinase
MSVRRLSASECELGADKRRDRVLLPLLAFGALMASIPGPTPGQAQAAPTGMDCADVEVVFARGTFEDPGLGEVGGPFVEELRSRLGEQTVDVHAVDYPASTDFARAAEGVLDASTHIRHLADSCPDTQVILGGYSQGAAVSAYVTSDAIPAGYPLPAGLNGPMPRVAADQVAAVALFGKPSQGIVSLMHHNAPPMTIGAPFAGKTLDLCAPADPICQFGGFDREAHSAYVTNGMIGQAADFAAQRVAS